MTDAPADDFATRRQTAADLRRIAVDYANRADAAYRELQATTGATAMIARNNAGLAAAVSQAFSAAAGLRKEAGE